VRILVLAGESADLGARATLLGLCRIVREVAPEAILATTLADESVDDGAAEPVSGAAEIHATARRSDVVLVTSDALRTPGLTEAAHLRLLAFRGARLAGVSLAASPGAARGKRRLRTQCLRAMRAATAADPESARELAAGDVPLRVLPDPALLVPAAIADVGREALAAAGAPRDGTPLIGVVPRAVRLHDMPPEAGTARFIDLLARTLTQTIEHHTAFVVCLPACAADVPLATALSEALPGVRACALPLLSPAAFKSVTSELAVLVSAHRRAALLGAAVGRPTVGLGDRVPLGAALAQAGGRHAFLEADLFVRGALVGQLADLLTTAIEVRRVSLVPIEELRAAARGGVRELMDGAA
jgi:hypothetical protein